MTQAARMLGVLLACVTPLQLAIAVLGKGMRRAVGGRLVQLGVAALVWCGAAAVVWWVSVRQASPVADGLLFVMAVTGAGLLGFVHRAHWHWWRRRGAADVLASGGVSAPGSLSFARGVAALGDRHYYLRQFATHGPVFRMSQFGAPTLCVLGLERRQAIIREHGSALGPAPLPFSSSVLRGFLRYMDDTTHNHYGPLMRRAMLGDTPAEVAAQLDRGLRARLQAAATQAAGPIEASAFIEPLVREALDLLLFGFGVDDPVADVGDTSTASEFTRLGTAFYRVAASKRLGAAEERLLGDLTRALEAQERQLQRDGRADTVPLGRIGTLDGRPADDTVLQNFVFMHRIATNNVSGLVSWLLVYWTQHPDIVARIRAAVGPERRFLLERFIAETLRLSQSEYTYRSVARTFAHEGVVYPAGWLVRFCVWESHRDDSAFEAPTEFRLRTGDQQYAKARYAPFGTGRHACNGADLNETLCVALLSLLVDEFDVHVTNAEPLRRAPRHWGHWQPNTRLMLQVATRGPA